MASIAFYCFGAVESMDQESAPWPSIRRATWTVAALVITAALCTMDRLVLVLIVDPIRQDLLISETQMSLLQGLSFAVLYSLVGIPLGVLADRTSRRNLLMLGVAVWSCGTFAAGLAGSFGHMFLARVFVGAGEATLWPVAISMIADLLPPSRRGRAVSAVLMGQIVGSSIALIVGGQVLRIAAEGGFQGVPLLSDQAPWRVLLMLWGALGVVAIVLLLSSLEPVRRNVSAATSVRLGMLKPFVAQVKSRWRVIAPLFVMTFFTGVVAYAGAAWMGAYFSRHFQVAPAQLGSWLGIVGLIAGLIGTGLGGVLSDRVAKGARPEQRALMMMVCILGCLPGALVVLAPTVAIGMLMYGVLAICSPLNGVLVFVATQDLFPGESRGVATAVLGLFAGLLGASAGPTLVALVTQHVLRDDHLVGYSLSIIQVPSLIAALVCAWLVRRALIRSARG